MLRRHTMRAAAVPCHLSPVSFPFFLVLQVRQDIVTTLRMRSPAQFTVSFFRPNLLFRVIQAGLKPAITITRACAVSMRRCVCPSLLLRGNQATWQISWQLTVQASRRAGAVCSSACVTLCLQLIPASVTRLLRGRLAGGLCSARERPSRCSSLSLPSAVCTVHPSWPQKDYARHEESGLEGYLHDMLTYIQ